MIYKNVELHNVAEISPVENGIRLQRIPDSVRAHLTEGGKLRSLQPDNAEIRFINDSPPAQITLSSVGQTDVVLFYGDFDGRQRVTVTREPVTIKVGLPDQRLQQLKRDEWPILNFSPRVCRLIMGGERRETIILHDIEGQGVRPPEPGDVPSLSYLAYGTSITHGSAATAPYLSYAGQTAWHLGADLINLGLGGSAHCEPELADYIAERDDWDIATLALSVNMQGTPMDKFYSRVSYMINTVAGKNPDKPVACITLYPYFRDFGVVVPGVRYGGTPDEYRQALRDAFAACPHDNLHLIEGPEILTDIRGLTHDLIHPADNGMIQMGYNLAQRLKKLL